MRTIKRALLTVLLLLGLTLTYLALATAPFEPVAWDPGVAPAMTGALAPNARLAGSELIAQGQLDGPEDVEIDAEGRIYVGTNDGVIWRVAGQQVTRFAETGGRPLGLEFAPDGALIVADAVKGLLSVDAAGAVRVLADSAEGQRFGFTDDVTVASDGVIYFSDASSKFGFGDHMLDLLEGRPYGRLLRHDPRSGVTTVLLRDLYFANGVALAADESFLVVSETYRFRLTRYWLQGPKAGSAEVFAADLPGFPDGVSRSGRGTFWVAMFTVRNPMGEFLAPRPFLRRMVANLPRMFWPRPEAFGLVLELDEQGHLLRSLQDPSGSYVEQVTSVHERDGKLYLGHLHRDRITRLAL